MSTVVEGGDRRHKAVSMNLQRKELEGQEAETVAKKASEQKCPLHCGISAFGCG